MPKDIYWDEGYALGHKELDKQHMKLFEIAGRIADLEEDANAKQQIKAILYDLHDYMRYHFDDEEAYMARIGYPGLQEHIRLHQKIVDDINNLITRPIRLNILKTSMKLFAKKMAY